MRCVLTGANGFLGSHLARALRARGDEVRCLVRPNSDASALAGLEDTVVRGDVLDADSLARLLDGADVCVHLAGVRRATSRDEFLRVNAEGTRIVAEAMVKAGTRRLVNCGSLAASGPAGLSRPRREEDPPCPEEWYGESKALGEAIAFEYANRLEVTSLRPSRILGPGDHENLTFFKLVKKGLVLRLLGPERHISMVDVDDVVAMTLLLVDRPEAKGEAFFCASEETMTLEAMMRFIATTLRVDARTVPVPDGLLRALAAGADLVSNATGRKLPLNRKLARQLLAPGWTCSIEKAKTRLGFRPTRSLTASLERSAEAYLAAGWL